ncbi:MAG: MarR family transcriptional regulator [Deltaproteobacteria bacterium]|nr:MarR family transcriptional regulator [Deltaproteobacteria bacterium]
MKDIIMVKQNNNKAGDLDEQMFVVRDFMMEFYNKSILMNENGHAELGASCIKALHAFIDENKGYPIGELGKNAGVKKTTMTDMVDRMERDGLAERIRDSNDRRVVMVRLTQKGQYKRKEFQTKRKSDFLNIMSQLSTEDGLQFIDHLKSATEILRKIH